MSFVMVLTLTSIACLVFASRLLVAQGAASGGTVWDGVFTEAQASRGEAAYGRSCAACHKEDLLGGGTAPALAGEAFFRRWNESTRGRRGADDEELDAAGGAEQPGCAGLRRHRDVSAQGERESHRIRGVDGGPRPAEAGPRHVGSIQVDRRQARQPPDQRSTVQPLRCRRQTDRVCKTAGRLPRSPRSACDAAAVNVCAAIAGAAGAARRREKDSRAWYADWFSYGSW